MIEYLKNMEKEKGDTGQVSKTRQEGICVAPSPDWSGKGGDQKPWQKETASHPRRMSIQTYSIQL